MLVMNNIIYTYLLLCIVLRVNACFLNFSITEHQQILQSDPLVVVEIKIMILMIVLMLALWQKLVGKK